MFFNTHKSYVQEVYFGKTPEIQKVENQLDKFRSKYFYNYNTAVMVNSDQDLLILNRMIEEQFGFGCFSLHIINEPLINAFTVPIDTRYDVFNTNKNLIANKSTFKFDKKADYTCVTTIYSGLIFNSAYTTDEIMAIIMHEIGHNFYAALNKKHAIFTNAFSIICFAYDMVISFVYPLKSLEIIKNTEIYYKITKKFEKILRKNNSAFITFIDIYNFWGSFINTIKYKIFFEFKDIISLGTLRYISALYQNKNKILNPFTYIFMPIKYDNEKLADNFVTMYGYSSSLTSAFNKMSSNKTVSPSKLMNAFNKIPVLSHIYAFNVSVSDILFHLFDVHPDAIIRCKDQIDMLEREVKKEDLDPKMRKVILADISACKSKINLLLAESDNIADKDILRNAWNRLLYNYFECKTIKELLLNDKNKFDAYDKTYNDKFTN